MSLGRCTVDPAQACDALHNAIISVAFLDVKRILSETNLSDSDPDATKFPKYAESLTSFKQALHRALLEVWARHSIDIGSPFF